MQDDDDGEVIACMLQCYFAHQHTYLNLTKGSIQYE